MNRPFDLESRPSDSWDGRTDPGGSLTAELVEVIRRYILVVAGAAIVTAAAAWLLASMQTRRYRVAAIAVVAPMTESMTGDERIRAIQALDQRVIIATAAALASTPVVQAQAAPSTGVKGDVYAIRALPLPDTNLLRIEVEGRDVARASEIANRMPAILSTQTQSIFHFFAVTAVSPAAEGELVAPRVGRSVAAGFVIGALLGLGIGWTLLKMRRAAPLTNPSLTAKAMKADETDRADAELEVLAGRPVEAISTHLPDAVRADGQPGQPSSDSPAEAPGVTGSYVSDADGTATHDASGGDNAVSRKKRRRHGF